MESFHITDELYGFFNERQFRKKQKAIVEVSKQTIYELFLMCLT